MANEVKNPLFKAASTNTENPVPMYAGRIEQSSVYDVESQLIRGTMSFSHDKLRELDPSYTGYTHIFVLKMPRFMTQVARGRVIDGYSNNSIAEAQKHCKNLKTLLEMGSTSYSGTPDLTMNTSQVSTGFSERNYPAPTFSQYDSTSFTIRCLETRGEPLRRSLEYYINGVSDANVKATMLNGACEDDGTLMEPTLPNYTFTLMVIQTDQTLRNIQDISLWNSCIITSAERSQLDWENGSIDIVNPMDVPFSGVYTPDPHNDAIDQLALRMLYNRLKLYNRYSDMTEEDFGTKYWQTTGAMY